MSIRIVHNYVGDTAGYPYHITSVGQDWTSNSSPSKSFLTKKNTRFIFCTIFNATNAVSNEQEYILFQFLHLSTKFINYLYK